MDCVHPELEPLPPEVLLLALGGLDEAALLSFTPNKGVLMASPGELDRPDSPESFDDNELLISNLM